MSFGFRTFRGDSALRRILAHPGLGLEHYQSGTSGVSVLVTPAGATTAVDVRGGGPGTRETDLLAPHNTVEQVHAIVLSGGSAFGLATADGVARHLADQGIGFAPSPNHPEVQVPIVPAAVIFDLLVGQLDKPDAAVGAAAAKEALQRVSNCALDDDNALRSGCVGAGVAAQAGAIKGGVGHAVVDLPGKQYAGQWVAAVVVANPVGAVLGETGHVIGDSSLPAITEDNRQTLLESSLGMTKLSSLNTTIGCLITNVALPVSQLQRLAMSGHDGLARAVYPAHTPLDGDTLFALSVPDPAAYVANDDAASAAQDPAVQDPAVQDPAALAMLSVAAADAVQHAVVDAVVSAESAFGLAAYKDLC